MNVLMISGDRNVLKEGSDAYIRLQLQRAQVETLDVFVWPQVHSLLRLLKAKYNGRYDVITAQDPFWRGHLAWHLTWLTRARLNIQVHTDLSAQPWLRRVWARFHLRRADSVRVVSEKIRAQVQAMGVGVPIYVLPVYVDIARFQNLVPVPHEQKTILWIGRFEDEKNPLAAISVLKEVRAKGIDAKLVMLGTGSLETMIRKSAEGLSVEFPGWKDPTPYLQTADVVLCTSLHESWGASMIEALAAGVPVVAPDIGIAKEAGATVVERKDLEAAVGDLLTLGKRGTLLIQIPNREEWVKKWKESLI